jgi:hypothetical protein
LFTVEAVLDGENTFSVLVTPACCVTELSITVWVTSWLLRIVPVAEDEDPGTTTVAEAGKTHNKAIATKTNMRIVFFMISPQNIVG